MKKSEMIQKLADSLPNLFTFDDDEDAAKNIINFLENEGMNPPYVPSYKIRGKDFPWGSGCSIRCNCNECDPDYPVNKWEKE